MEALNPFLSMHVPALRRFKVTMYGDDTVTLHISAVSASALIDKIKGGRLVTPHNMTDFHVEAV